MNLQKTTLCDAQGILNSKKLQNWLLLHIRKVALTTCAYQEPAMDAGCGSVA